MKLRPSLESMVPYTPGVLIPGKLKLASNENPLGPSPMGKQAFLDAANSLSLYPDGAARVLKAALAAKFSISTQELILGNGSDELILMLAATYLEPGSHVLIGEHTFSEYQFAAKIFAAAIERIPMPQGTFTLEGITSMLRPDTTMVFICSPNNPTGTLFPMADLHKLMSLVGPQTLVVLDAAYAEYAHDDQGRPYCDDAQLIKTYPNLVILHTFSKLYGLAGLRVGYGISNAQVIAHIERTRQPFNVNLPAQMAAAQALEDHGFIAQSLETNKNGKAILYELLETLKLPYHGTHGNFVCFSTPWDAKEVYDLVMEYGVTIRPLGSFGLPRSLRVTIGTKDQLSLFATALTKALDELQRQKPLPRT